MTKAPPGIAKFDSASAMTLSLAHYLNGENFSGLGQSAFMQLLARQADLVPRHLRERVFARMGAREGIPPKHIEQANANDTAEWLASLYPKRRYPAIAVGSANGALLHLYAALGIPWLTQTFLTLVEQTHVHPDDPEHALRAERETAARFLQANPDVNLHHLHDPNQDRLMLGLITYYRAKYTRLPPAYREFITQNLAPGGTIYVPECHLQWPVTRVDERYVFQFGAVGGATFDDYFNPGERVEKLLRHYDSPVQRWNPPTADTHSPEAEWGFAPELRDELIEFAHENGYRLVRVQFDEPEQPSELVAGFYRDWYRERDIPARRLLVESFVVNDPYGALQTGSVPYWMVFNMQPSLDHLNRYLDSCADDPYEEIMLMLFSHGAESIGLPPIEDWQRVLKRAGRHGELLGIDPESYPAHFAHFGRYSQSLLRAAAPHYLIPDPLPLARVENYLAEHGARFGVKIEGESDSRPPLRSTSSPGARPTR